MLFLGIASIVQIVFLPGYLAVRALRLRADWLQTLILSFALSQVLNHFVVVALTAVGIYRAPVIYAVFAAEALFCLWLLRSWLAISVSDCVVSLIEFHRRVAATIATNIQDRVATLRALVWILAGLAIGILVIGSLLDFGGIFRLWDAVVSWNRWAMEWGQNKFPDRTFEYPQLMPSNWSLSYVFIRETGVWSFAKATTPCYLLVMLLSMLSLGGKTRQLGYALGVIITYLLAIRMTHIYSMPVSGYADIPAASFAFIAVYCIIAANCVADRTQRVKYVFLGAVLASGAALTKQSGLFIALTYPLLACVLVERPPATETGAKRFRTFCVVGSVVLIISLVSPWYLYKLWQIHIGQDASIVQAVTHTIHGGRTTVERLAYALSLLAKRWSLPGLCFLGVFILLAMRNRVQRWLVAIVVIPYSFIWALGFSYGVRTLALALPFAGVAAGVGAVELCHAISLYARRNQIDLVRWLPDVSRWRVGHFMVFCAVGLTLLSVRFDRDDLLTRQHQLERSIGSERLNERLYAYNDLHAFQGKIVSNYQHLGYLPQLSEFYQLAQDLETYQDAYEDPSVECALLFGGPRPVFEYFDSSVAKGESELIFDMSSVHLYRKTKVR